MTTDAITNGESFLSEHFLAASGSQSFQGRVTDRRKVWDASSKDGEETPRTRFAASRQTLISQLAEVSGAITEREGRGGDGDRADLVAKIRPHHLSWRAVLGFERIGLVHRTEGPVHWISAAGLSGATPLAIVEALPGDLESLLAKDSVNLIEPFEVDEKLHLVSVSRLLSHLFTLAEAPSFALVQAGPLALLAEQSRWHEGRYLAVDLQLVADRNDGKRGGEIDQALTTLAAESLAPDAEGSIWWADLLEESVKNTVGVSKDLREGVRLSIEIIANEVVRRRTDQGLPSLPPDQAQRLAKESLRFLYRILFLLYAESSPHLQVLPTGVTAYDRGYGLDRLRELTLVEIEDERDRRGSHLYDSLAVLFRMVDEGHDGTVDAQDDLVREQPLSFAPLKADLFKPDAVELITEVGLGNEAMQRVLRHLLLTKQGKRKRDERGFISYADLGINQLGAVYEGLMSYSGFFADEDLFEVAKDGNSEKGSWVVPVDRSDEIADKDFVTAEDPFTGERRRVLHSRGTFVYRLAGRERQQSASYYTPEVLTRFTVSQALEELLDQNGTKTSAREILDLTVCEPALGSGAFAIEAVRQLAGEYLQRRQDELGTRIDPDAYPAELQKVKAYLALHNVYGVDLNATAVELAEISLWLDTMGQGLQAPWFGLHLRRGNSLIGARRAVFRRDQVAAKTWFTDMPQDLPLTSSDGIGDGVHHFLLPAEGWGSAINAKEAKNLAPEALARLKAWRRSVLVKPTRQQVDQLGKLAQRVEVLWRHALQRLTIAEEQIRRSIDVWGAEDLPVGGAVTRQEIEESLVDARGAYQRLKTVMDAWNALWFWPLTDELISRVVVSDDGSQRVERVLPPSLDQWIDGLRGLLGWRSEESSTGRGRRWQGGDQTLAAGAEWAELAVAETTDLAFAGAETDLPALYGRHRWLEVCAAIAAQQGFFHWDLMFAPVFAQRGGFDLQVGNPPWVRPRSDVDALLAEGDPWFQLAVKPTQAEVKRHRDAALALPGIETLVIDGTADVAVTAAYLGSKQQYPHLVGLQPDLYRCFMEQTWRAARPTGSGVPSESRVPSVAPGENAGGTVGLIHLESHFTDEGAGPLRAATYRRLRRHAQFVNETKLFPEIQNQKRYGVAVYGSARTPGFIQATSLYSPATFASSLRHDGGGPEPGIKDEDGNWDLRPHAARIERVDLEVLRAWHGLLEDDTTPVEQTRMVYTVNRAASSVLTKLARAPRLGTIGFRFSRGWDESIDRKRGRFETLWGVPESWDQVILQGPHLYVGNPFYKAPNKSMKNHLDWTPVDLEALPADAIPTTSYKPAGDEYEYDCAYTDWGTEENPDPARDHYRIAWRNMAANTGERTLIPALIPPGATHIHGLSSIGFPGDPLTTLAASAILGSLLSDFIVRAAPKSTITAGVVGRLAYPVGSGVVAELALRAAGLQLLTKDYASLWDEATSDSQALSDETGRGGVLERPTCSATARLSNPVPLRRASDRRQALIEIDALVALALGVTADEWCTIYRTQFPVLYGYDRNTYYYDANGRLVPTSVLQAWRKKGNAITGSERTHVHPGSGVSYTYEPPFITLDREADFRESYHRFTQGDFRLGLPEIIDLRLV
ncbi:hypothetical protein EDD28_3227 [Salana multivorans]|uniref:site-specific DNA-methyltransferase (adenine-specific) n=1 Tax=Salana multivorans TaxID=120377 RepID=A0A3N2D1Z9_9MICO|nr:class I SAM-dependent DNA methyltransferase [Salana multivorans]ROR93800.1 hypothetical protein EDD28_3227 [Salana multivorans]